MKIRIINLLSALFLIVSYSFAQSQNTEFGVWKLMNKKDGIEVYGKHDLCRAEPAPNDYHFLSIKIVNTNPIDKEVSLYIKNIYKEGANGDRDESLTMVNLKANETLEGTCYDENATLTRMIANPAFKGGWNYVKSEIIFESIK
jgi:hypothetical protein